MIWSVLAADEEALGEGATRRASEQYTRNREEGESPSDTTSGGVQRRIGRRVVGASTAAEKQKAVVRKTVAPETAAKTESIRADPAPWATRSTGADMRCYACREFGHFARECPNAEAKAQNDAFLASRAAAKNQSTEGNVERA